LIFFASAGAYAQQGPPMVELDGFIACQHRDTLDKILEYNRAGDKEAVFKLKFPAFLAKECIGLKRGQVIFITDYSIWRGTIKLRPRGDIAEFWTYYDLNKLPVPLSQLDKPIVIK
jgi:hypothetical protein